MHCYNGNPPKGRGRVTEPKGRGKGKGLPPPTIASTSVSTDFTEGIATRVSRVLPQAAILRAQSELIPAEWSVPICPHQTLGPQGGVSLVHRDDIHKVVQRVTHTTRPTAILISEPPEEGL